MYPVGNTARKRIFGARLCNWTTEVRSPAIPSNFGRSPLTRKVEANGCENSSLSDRHFTTLQHNESRREKFQIVKSWNVWKGGAHWPSYTGLVKMDSGSDLLP
jgi:hypothetical protein